MWLFTLKPPNPNVTLPINWQSLWLATPLLRHIPIFSFRLVVHSYNEMRQKVFTIGLQDVLVLNVQLGSRPCDCNTREESPQNASGTVKGPIQRYTFTNILRKFRSVGKQSSGAINESGDIPNEQADSSAQHPAENGVCCNETLLTEENSADIPNKQTVSSVQNPTENRKCLDETPSIEENSGLLPLQAKYDALLETLPKATDLDSCPNIESESPLPTATPLGLFGKLPLEIRVAIWALLLILPSPNDMIKDAYKLVGDRESIRKSAIPIIDIVKSGILQTSRAIYAETLPMLYGDNTFYFSRTRDIMEFGHCGIEKNYRTHFATQPAIYGRNSIVRLVYLKISGLGGQFYSDVDKENDHIWTEWRDFFTSKVRYRRMGFPALERLVLDFTDWRLTAAESSALTVSICTGKLPERMVDVGFEEVEVLHRCGLWPKQRCSRRVSCPQKCHFSDSLPSRPCLFNCSKTNSGL